MKRGLGYFRSDFLRYPVEFRFLILIPGVASLLTAMNVIEGLFLNDTFFVLSCLISTLVFLGTYFLIRVKTNLRYVIWIMVLNTLILTNIVWFRFEGSKGTSPAIIMMLVVSISLFFKKIEKIFAITVVLINLFILCYLEFSFPDLINHYTSQIIRIIDLIITYSVCAIFIVFVIHGILQSYMHEKIKAGQVDKLKAAFLLNISHEFRTPMNAIMGFSNLITQPETKRKDKLVYSKFLSDACKSLINLIEEIIEVAKIESNQVNIIKVRCNVTDVVRDIYYYFNNLPEKKALSNVNLYVNEASVKKDVYIDTDPSILKQVLQNLINNSLKFTSNGFVEFGYHIRSSDLLFYVKDSGIGIPEEDGNRIFDSFLKAEHMNGKLYKGIGLGLTLSKKILELLNGEIWFNSKINQGTTFYFTVPYNKIETNQV